MAIRVFGTKIYESAAKKRVVALKDELEKKGIESDIVFKSALESHSLMIATHHEAAAAKIRKKLYPKYKDA